MKRFKKEVVARGNDFAAVINEILLPLTLDRLRSGLTMTSLVSRDTSDVAKKKGDEVTVELPVEFGAADDFTGVSVPSDIDVNAAKVILNNHKYKEFKLSDVDAMRHASQSTLPSALAGAADSIAEAINLAIYNCYKDVANFSGVLGSETPRNKADLIGARKVAQDAKMGRDRKIVLSSDTESEMLLEFDKVNESGDQSAVTEGIIGRKYGFDIYADQQAPYHIAGTASSVTTMTTSANFVGSPFLNISNVPAGTTFVRGDVISIAGGFKFAVAFDTEVPAGETAVSVQIVGKVTEQIPPNSAVDVAASHAVDIAFTPAAFMIAFRQLEAPEETPGTIMGSITDPITGVTLRLLKWYDASSISTHWKLEVLFGVKTIDPRRALRIGGH